MIGIPITGSESTAVLAGGAVKGSCDEDKSGLHVIFQAADSLPTPNTIYMLRCVDTHQLERFNSSHQIKPQEQVSAVPL